MVYQSALPKVFLCHASEDKELVLEIYEKLKVDGFLPWIDKEDILPGQFWKEEIPRAIRSATCMIVFLSSASVSKRGYIQKEFRLALETLDEIPEEQIFLIPVRIDSCKIPSRFAGIQYCDLFKKNGYERVVKALRKSILSGHKEENIEEGLVQTIFPSQTNLPLNRNVYFYGRKKTIIKLRNEIIKKGKVALTGIPGVGKTQIAIEYAYRFGSTYRSILWSRAENNETMVSSFIQIAEILNLPEKNEQKKDHIISAVLNWLSKNDRWLLVYDNIENMSRLSNFIPIGIKGHILITTRAQAIGGVAQRIHVKPFLPKDGARYILHRSGIISSKSEDNDSSGLTLKGHAESLSTELGGLPLSLDQAGAFMEENSVRPDEYLSLYRVEGKSLRESRGQHDTSSQGHSKSVSITFNIAFRKIIDLSPAAAELIRLCAFLYPEQIQEKAIFKSVKDMGDILGSTASNNIDWIKARKAACRLSLLFRELDNKSLNIHRVVQAVIKDEMPLSIRKKWAKRAVIIINSCFPNPIFSNWPDCEKLISQGRTCVELINEFRFAFPEAGRLLIALADYNHYRGRFLEAETLYRYAVIVTEKVHGKSHPKVGTCINNLAVLYYRKGNYNKAEIFYKRDIDIQKRHFGLNHRNVGTAMNNLAEVYRIQGKYEEAESLYRRALKIINETLGSDHPNAADTLNNLGLLFWNKSKLVEAEKLCKCALIIRKKALQPNHPAIADSMTNIASIYRDQNKFKQADDLYQRALIIRLKTLGSKHPDVANSLKNIGLLYIAMRREKEAKRFFLQAIDIINEAHLNDSDDAKTLFNTYRKMYTKT